MILTVTLNAALDITYHLRRLRLLESNRVDAVAARAGGKGINVSRVLHALGHETVVTGLAGGPTGHVLRHELAAAGLRDELVTIEGETRRTVAVVDESRGDTTIFLERGPVVTAAAWAQFLHRYERLLPRAAAVVLAGSLPDGLSNDAYAVLIRRARTHRVPVVLDADGEALRAGVGEAPAVIKPNAVELGAASGSSDPHSGAAALRAAGAQAVVASLGPDGLIACSPQGSWRARPPQALSGNPTGAGDAAVAALALGLVAGVSWPAMLVEAVALSAAAVAAPLAGDFDSTVYRRLQETVTVETVAACPADVASDAPNGAAVTQP
ncbi:1-phosphofructokinase family hexose kinase [Streptomyces luteolifulvus]|uniref:1-phosphofructokinase family hexose kinase n=1 Tax=Streptomyces luteolifulvus TaxID=2615112 RepID=A0A6H9UQY9_9ACTN|nr:1-phosphofructokinase family hexose kinase [Streptomyces luteolifulvus]KAB1141251.1 1-phosphofructokinase family hexose kinase [Streptomyces luteolifulvus]